MMKLLINVVILLSQWNMISADPGIVEVSPEFKRSREKFMPSTKLSSYNLITDNAKTTTPTTASSLQSFKITAEDVVTGSNAVYGSSANLQNGGIIFAFSDGQGSTSQPLQSAAPPQPVLMQFLSPEGTPKQAAVQYIQLLRPLMMIPGSQYSQPIKSNPTYEPEMKAMHYGPPANLNPMFEPDFRIAQYSQSLSSNPIQTYEPEIRTTLPISSSPKPKFDPSFSPFIPYQYQRQPIVGAYSSPQSSYFQTNPLLFEEPRETSQPDTGFNTNEYIPSASSQHASMVLAPRSSMMSALSPFAYKPKPHKQLSQRAKK